MHERSILGGGVIFYVLLFFISSSSSFSLFFMVVNVLGVERKQQWTCWYSSCWWLRRGDAEMPLISRECLAWQVKTSEDHVGGSSCWFAISLSQE